MFSRWCGQPLFQTLTNQLKLNEKSVVILLPKCSFINFLFPIICMVLLYFSDKYLIDVCCYMSKIISDVLQREKRSCFPYVCMFSRRCGRFLPVSFSTLALDRVDIHHSDRFEPRVTHNVSSIHGSP